jgi:hypothetical protein
VEADALLGLEPKARAKPTEAELLTKALLPRFARMLSVVMTDQLRSVVLASVHAFRAFWAAYAMAAPFELAEEAEAVEAEVEAEAAEAAREQVRLNN